MLTIYGNYSCQALGKKPAHDQCNDGCHLPQLSSPPQQQQQQAASSNQQQQPAAASSSSKQQQQPAAASGSFTNAPLAKTSID
jgi:hypothetical protein